MTEDITLTELMEDLKLQTELGNDKTKLEERRLHKQLEKEHKDEVKRNKRKRVGRTPESIEERKLRKYRTLEVD